MQSEDFGKDLASVQGLQRKHDALERDLTALQDRVATLEDEARRMRSLHPDHAAQIDQKLEELSRRWTALRSKATHRKQRLDDSYHVHRFLSDYRDLVAWITDMKGVIKGDELAKDVPGAEALLERHNEHKTEIDAHEDSYHSAVEAGESLIKSGHYAHADIDDKVRSFFIGN